MKVAIIKYNAGNTGSVANALKRLASSRKGSKRRYSETEATGLGGLSRYAAFVYAIG